MLIDVFLKLQQSFPEWNLKIIGDGEEYNILRGMEKNLKKGNIKLFKVELCFPLMHKNVNCTYLDVLNYLKRFGYNLFSISKIKYKNNEI